MIELKTHKFSDLYKMSSGISSKPEQSGHGFPFLSFKNVFDDYFLPDQLQELMDVSILEKEKYSIREGDIFLTRTSETIDQLGMSSVALKDYTNATFSGFLKRLRPINKKEVYPKYIAYYLRAYLFRKAMDNNTVMTLRASFNEQIFSYLNLVLPNYQEQIKIGDFLYSISHKIKLNQEISKNLKELSKLIYDFWFIQYDFPNENGDPYKSSGGKMVYNQEIKREIPEGWKIKSLNSVIEYNSGFSFESNTYTKSGNWKVITIKSVTDDGLDSSKCDKIDILPENIDQECILNTGDLLMSLTGNTGRLSFVDEPKCLLNQRVAKLWSSTFSNLYLYLFLIRPEQQKLISQMSSGSSQANLSLKQLFKHKIIIPAEETLNNFEQFILPISTSILSNKIENKNLVKLRDWLIPILMNGKVKVS